ncbi:primosomal protein N' [Bombilactobacillus thymidiniphilus]|uniref:primosomal protein N' n=1 Tax=Bombilactobacillus thymidiniphilus TaxID=2923363 RepID=UPI0037BEF064
MYAQVIVDVPTQQTDHTFDYIVPDALVQAVVPGIRVAVPFGRGQRLVQGFVITTSNTSSFAKQAKAIDHVLDFAPVLNTELLDLSRWLAYQSFAFRISCLQTMLPNVMRAKYHKIAVAQDPTLQKSTFFNGQNQLILDDKLSLATQRQIVIWQKENKITLKYQVQDQAKHVQQWFLMRADLDYAELLTTINTRAKRQRQLIELFCNPTLKKISFTKLQQQYHIDRSVINKAVNNHWFTKKQEIVLRNPNSEPISKTTAKKLTAEQDNALQQIINAKKPVLLEGVTGSGKTEVYLQTIEHYLKQGKTALMLVPEISLTPQMVEQVRGRFGSAVAVLHSGLSKGERYDEWSKIEAKQVQVVVGARSAVFAPLTNLGVIIIDEEHETSYKQNDNPRYHARSVALWRGRYHNCTVILGSATPSLESRARGQKGVYQLVQLPHRVANQELPPVEIVDMRQSENLTEQLELSKPLVKAIALNLENKEQTILLLNRRGFASFVLCRQCGFVPQCPNCDVSLTVHLQQHNLVCHYCGFKRAIEHQCRQCKSTKLRYSGTGTQKIEQQLQQMFTDAKIIRMDNDTTTKKGSHQRLLRQFATQGDILLGTQMIAKGLDFPNVTLVGVINADTGLNVNDFRSSEQTFQLLTQVSGRAGRSQKAGRVFIQTYNPDNAAIILAAQQNYELFYQREMQFRHQAAYPPYFYLIKVTVSHRYQAQALKMAYNIIKQIKPVLKTREQLLGPTQPPIGRIKQRYYYQIIIKYRQNEQLFTALHQLLNEVQSYQKRGFLVAIDNEAQQLE